jgi:predicted nucleotidyltransferase component of viral defense system
MTDQYGTPRAFRQALETRLMTQAKATGVDLGRLRRQVVFERLLARLAEGEAGAPSWVLKGGFALELRLGNVSRTTRDLDLATLDGEVDGHRVWTHLSTALEEDVGGDNFSFAVAAPRPLAADMAGRPGWRFSVDARLAGKSFAMVRMDVVARAEEITDAIEPLTFSSALAFAGLAPSVTVPAIDVAQHAAEKFHALTRIYGDRPNTRVKDLVDLVLLTELNLIDLTRLTGRVRTVFRVRATHPMPTELPEPPSAWRDDYLGLIEELDIGARTIEGAMAVVRPVWRICVENAGDPS